MFQSRQSGFAQLSPMPSHTRTHTCPSKLLGGREGRREGAGRASSPDISRVRRWVGLEHEFIYFRPTSGIKGACSQGQSTAGSGCCRSPESFVKEERCTPASRSTQPTTAERQPTRANHKAPPKAPGRRKASLLSLTLGFK